MTVKKGEYSISTDKERLDLSFVHGFLSKEAYWSLGIPFEVVEKSVRNSLCFGVYHGEGQVGFARIITDFATVAYLGDVFIVQEHRGKGLSKWLVEVIRTHPELQGLRRWVLLTQDAHGLYRQFGWKDIAHPERYMEIAVPDIYKKKV
ncbi:MAG: GNAT family N-acetyltransferase [Bacteroidetes bacterium]|nr:GNAT family N-acetyltransferase [Bacteroidota bacterium]